MQFVEWKLMLIVQITLSLLKNSKAGVLWARNLQNVSNHLEMGESIKKLASISNDDDFLF